MRSFGRAAFENGLQYHHSDSKIFSGNQYISYILCKNDENRFSNPRDYEGNKYWIITVSLLFARVDTAMPGGLHARLCHTFLVCFSLLKLIFATLKKLSVIYDGDYDNDLHGIDNCNSNKMSPLPTTTTTIRLGLLMHSSLFTMPPLGRHFGSEFCTFLRIYLNRSIRSDPASVRDFETYSSSPPA